MKLPTVKKPADALAAVEAEIREEMASSLGRVGRVIDEQLAEMARLVAELPGLVEEAREAHVAAYNRARAKAQEYLFYLMVQREAMGLRNHDGVERMYRIPPALR